MIDAIVTSIGEDTITASPTQDVDLKSLIGKRAVYTDNSNNNWEGKVISSDESGVVIKFKSFPKSIGQGQILQILDPGETIEQSEE